MCQLRELRRDQNLSGVELAEIADCSYAAIYQLERGDRPGGWRLRRKVCRALGISESVIWPEPDEAAKGAT